MTEDEVNETLSLADLSPTALNIQKHEAIFPYTFSDFVEQLVS